MSERYPPLQHYALISDCHSAALVSRAGSIDWCCMPRFDAGSYFGRLLDWDRGGYCAIEPATKDSESFQEYIEGTLVLATTFRTRDGQARLYDFFTITHTKDPDPHRRLLRVVECERGHVEFELVMSARFDYGSVRPWLRKHRGGSFSATGGDDGLVVWSDAELEIADEHDLRGGIELRAGQRVRLSLESALPAEIDREPPREGDADEIDRLLDETREWWRGWSAEGRSEMAETAGTDRSAIVLKALSYEPTGAIIGAPTASLPESVGGSSNWDYRYSWVRDSTLSARSLAELGHDREADRFRRFIQRSAAGHARDLQITYGVGGERRLGEQELDLEGYRGSSPVRVGNSAYDQLQLDAYGELVNLVWRWHRRGHSPDDDDWRFVLDLVETAIERWQEPDSGIWEVRDDPQHFVHSKVLCWSAVDRGLSLAEECLRKAPTRSWERAREEIRDAIEARGYDAERGVFVRAFGVEALDASLLLLPTFGFLAWDDERMVRTADAIREELDAEGLIRRYDDPEEGAFVACSFWLVECLARQARVAEARELFDRATGGANELGLFSEMLDPQSGELLGNFPQGLSHLSHIAAALALVEAEEQVRAG